MPIINSGAFYFVTKHLKKFVVKFLIYADCQFPMGMHHSARNACSKQTILYSSIKLYIKVAVNRKLQNIMHGLSTLVLYI